MTGLVIKRIGIYSGCAIGVIILLIAILIVVVILRERKRRRKGDKIANNIINLRLICSYQTFQVPTHRC